MLTQGTVRQKTTKELQRIRDLVSSSNFKEEVDIQKGVINKLKKRVDDILTPSGLETIEKKLLNIPENIDLTSSSKTEVESAINQKRDALDKIAVKDFIDENTKRNDLYFDSKTGIPKYNWTLGLTDAFGISKEKGREIVAKSKQRISIL